MGHASKHRLASLLACLSLSDTNNNNKRLCCFLVSYTSGPHLVPGADGAVFDQALLLQAEPLGPGCLRSAAPWQGGGLEVVCGEPLPGTCGRKHAGTWWASRQKGSKDCPGQWGQDLPSPTGIRRQGGTMLMMEVEAPWDICGGPIGLEITSQMASA